MESNFAMYLSRSRKGGTRKIADAPPPPCQHPEHNPPSMMVWEPGTYEHTCPHCGHVTLFNIVYSVYSAGNSTLFRVNESYF